MKNYYEKEQQISTAYSDRRCEMGIYHATLLFQDAMTELFYQYACDATRISKTHGAVWAVARSKFTYEKMPVWMDTVRVRCFPVKITPVTVHLNTVVESVEGELLVRCRQEICAIDVKDHSLRKVDTTPFPRDMELLPPVYDVPFRRKKVEVQGNDLAYRHLIRTADTDMNGHMNNVAYVRLVMNAFPTAFWNAHAIESFDIQYVSEGKEGEELQIFCQQDGNEYICIIKAQERTLVKAFLRFAD